MHASRQPKGGGSAREGISLETRDLRLARPLISAHRPSPPEERDAMGKTLYQKVWDAHTVGTLADGRGDRRVPALVEREDGDRREGLFDLRDRTDRHLFAERRGDLGNGQNGLRGFYAAGIPL